MKNRKELCSLSITTINSVSWLLNSILQDRETLERPAPSTKSSAPGDLTAAIHTKACRARPLSPFYVHLSKMQNRLESSPALPFCVRQALELTARAAHAVLLPRRLLIRSLS